MNEHDQLSLPFFALGAFALGIMIGVFLCEVLPSRAETLPTNIVPLPTTQPA